MRAALLLFLFGTSLSAAAISGTVKDPSGAAVGKAAVVLTNAAGSTSTASDAQGRFAFSDVAAGAYLLAITHDGFEPQQRTVTIGTQPVALTLTLQLARVKTTVEVSGGHSPLRNSDPNYQALRASGMRSVYRVKDLVLKRDAGTFTFRSGAFSFLPPVLGQVTAGAFVGDGNFSLTPPQPVLAAHLKQISGAATVDEEFGSMVIYFTDDTYQEITAHTELVDESPKPQEEAFHRVQEALRHRDDIPQTYLQRLLDADDVPNMEGEMLAEIYNRTGGSFRAFIHGRKNSGLRFLLNPRGAMPSLPAPEEVALLDYDPGSNHDGIWYLAHTLEEQKSGIVSSSEEKRLIAADHYHIETAIGRNLHLSVVCDMTFRALREGVRVIKFDLLPDLQVARLRLDGKEIPFLQENRKQDGSFYVVLAAPLERFRTYQATFEYEGGEMMRDMGGKLYFMRPRVAWYPRAGVTTRSTFDLIFRVPRDMTVIATGNRVKSEVQGGELTTEWKSDAPVPVAGFNYGTFNNPRPRVDESSGFTFNAYLGSKAAGYLMPDSSLGLDRAENAIRIFDRWFGEIPFDHLSVSEANVSDSMPGLIFVPTIMMTDTSSRYGSINNAMSDRRRRGGGGGGGGGAAMAIPQITGPVFDESLAREVARQWWGNLVTPVSFHDEWLVRGLADFSGSAYDIYAESDTNDFLEHWRRSRDLLLTKTFWGIRRADTAPVWLGTMAESMLVQRSVSMAPGSFARPFLGPSTALTGMKGGFIIQMLRSLMFDRASGDRDFVAMMHDFTARFQNHNVSTEEFQYLVENHMKPAMDLEGNHRMNWFFRQWVYGTELPAYQMTYSTSKEGGKTVVQGKLTQSGVSDTFLMRVPVYARFAAKPVLIGAVSVAGNKSSDFRIVLPEEPKKILLNANYDVLCTGSEVKQVR